MSSRTARSLRRVFGLATLAVVATSAPATAQVDLSVGVLVHPSPSVGSTRVGPLVAVAASGHSFGVPLFVEAGLARTEFASLGMDYHHNYVLLSLGAEWFPTDGATRIGLRLGGGAVGEFEVVETDPSTSGGGGWTSAVSPGLIVERGVGGGRSLVLALSDHVLGPLNALFDREEYRFDHRVVIRAGVRF